MLFVNSQNMVSNDGKLIFDLQITVHHFFKMSPLFSQMSPLFQELGDIVPGLEISRQNTAGGGICHPTLRKTTENLLPYPEIMVL